VGLALQSCIGGNHRAFNDFQLSDRRFRFSVASNKVGHFIYGLRDRVWPDFVCHFSLFKGVHPSISGFIHKDKSGWHSEVENIEVAQRAPTLFKPKLDVLFDSARVDHSSAAELAKFGFSCENFKSPPQLVNRLQQSGDPNPGSSSSAFSVKFGSFSEPVILESQSTFNGHFYNHNFARKLCATIDKEILEPLEVLSLARYKEEEIMVMLNFPFIPPKDLVFEFLGYCSRCGLHDHLRANCPGICLDCQLLGFRCHSCSLLPS
jgi:hypothetical protein